MYSLVRTWEGKYHKQQTDATPDLEGDSLSTASTATYEDGVLTLTEETLTYWDDEASTPTTAPPSCGGEMMTMLMSVFSRPKKQPNDRQEAWREAPAWELKAVPPSRLERNEKQEFVFLDDLHISSEPTTAFSLHCISQEENHQDGYSHAPSLASQLSHHLLDDELALDKNGFLLPVEKLEEEDLDQALDAILDDFDMAAYK